MNKYFIIILILGGVIVLLTLLKIYLLNNFSVEDVDYNSLLQQIHALHDENMTLQDTLLEDSSYHEIWGKMTSQGYVTGTPIYLR